MGEWRTACRDRARDRAFACPHDPARARIKNSRPARLLMANDKPTRRCRAAREGSSPGNPVDSRPRPAKRTVPCQEQPLWTLRLLINAKMPAHRPESAWVIGFESCLRGKPREHLANREVSTRCRRCGCGRSTPELRSYQASRFLGQPAFGAVSWLALRPFPHAGGHDIGGVAGAVAARPVYTSKGHTRVAVTRTKRQGGGSLWDLPAIGLSGEPGVSQCNRIPPSTGPDRQTDL